MTNQLPNKTTLTLPWALLTHGNDAKPKSTAEQQSEEDYDFAFWVSQAGYQ